MKKIASIILIFVAIVFATGCVSPVVQDSPQGQLRAHYEYRDDWSPGLGCYDLVTGYVYNAGNTSADNVRLDFNLVNTRTGTIRDSKSIFVGYLGQGDSKTYEVSLDGECTESYRVDFFSEPVK